MRKSQYLDLEISLRPVNHEGISELWWVSQDAKAFLGPLNDWKNDRDKFLHYVKNKNTVVQAGGNCGLYARFYGNYFNTVYSFEPNPDNFSCLRLNCSDTKYHLYNVALGEKFGKAELYFPKKKFKNAGAWKIQLNDSGYVDVITIDSLNLDSCDLMHLDVEEFEPYVLRGALETIKKFNPVIILENGHGHEVVLPLGYKIVEKLTSDWVLINE
jgi:FkbM family methyltransferase